MAERRDNLNGRLIGWHATRDTVAVPAFGTLTARKGSTLWRTRDTAAAGIAFDAVQHGIAPKKSMPVKRRER